MTARQAPARRLRARRVARGGPRRPRRARAVLALILLAGLLFGVWLWVRDSSLVAVRRVQVLGAYGPDGGAIRSALASAARSMTTLDVSMPALRSAVAAYPVVKRLQVRTEFPHGMRIRVVEQVPVAALEAGGRRVLVAGDGTLLRDSAGSDSLPAIAVAVPPGGEHVTGQTLVEVQLAAAAPYQLLARVQSIGRDAAHGLLAQIRNGPVIYFGDASQAGAKWSAAAEVLASQGSAGASYIDVTVPSRPAAGVGSDTSATPAATASAATSGSTSTGASASTAPSGSTTAPSSSTPGASTAALGSTAPSGSDASGGTTASGATGTSGSTAPATTQGG